MKRKLRRVIEVVVPLSGMGVIFGSVLFGSPNNLQLQVILLLIGVLILEAGVWGVTKRILPDERRFPGLRAEVGNFLELIPLLNAAAVARDDGHEDDARFEESLAELRASVERMAELAGRGEIKGAEEAEPATEIPPKPAGSRLRVDEGGRTAYGRSSGFKLP